MKRVLDAKFEI